MTSEPIPQADDADLAEQARPVDDDVDESDSLADDYGDAGESDTGTMDDQRPMGYGTEEGRRDPLDQW